MSQFQAKQLEDDDNRPKLEEIWESRSKATCYGTWELFLQYVRRAWKNTKSSLVTSLVTVLTVALALVVGAFFLLLSENVTALIQGVRTDVGISIYLKDGANSDQVEALRKELEGDAGIQSVTYLSKSEALVTFGKSLGENDALLQGLEENNPLPASFEIQVADKNFDRSDYDRFSEKFGNLEVVDAVYFNSGALDKISSFYATLLRFGIPLFVGLLIVISLIVSNTIRLALYNHRQEVEIMRLEGATRWYIVTPFLVEGGLQGLLGAVIALSISYGAASAFQSFLTDSTFVSGLGLELHGLSFVGSLMILLAGVLVGVVGSYVAARRLIHD